jgi:hypothetical protein
MHLDQEIKDWLAARGIRRHGDALRADYAELGVFHRQDLWGEIRVTHVGGGSFHIEVLRGRFELDDFWTDEAGFAAIMDAALQTLGRRIREGAPEWSVHLL